MLVARAQLDLVRSFVAEFSRSGGEMRPIALIHAQYVAAVVTLRSVGHVLLNVDADTPGKREWLRERWPAWKVVPIFADFIEPGRNALLKQARGMLDASGDAFGPTAVVVDPLMPGDVSVLAGFDASEHLTDGRPTLALFREAIAFWDVRIAEAERAFAARG